MVCMGSETDDCPSIICLWISLLRDKGELGTGGWERTTDRPVIFALFHQDVKADYQRPAADTNDGEIVCLVAIMPPSQTPQFMAGEIHRQKRAQDKFHNLLIFSAVTGRVTGKQRMTRAKRTRMGDRMLKQSPARPRSNGRGGRRCRP